MHCAPNDGNAFLILAMIAAFPFRRAGMAGRSERAAP
jgi:hypothetical protein